MVVGVLLDVAVDPLDGDVHALANGAVGKVGGLDGGAARLVTRPPAQVADVIDFDLQTAALGHSSILQIAVLPLARSGANLVMKLMI